MDGGGQRSRVDQLAAHSLPTLAHPGSQAATALSSPQIGDKAPCPSLADRAKGAGVGGSRRQAGGGRSPATGVRVRERSEERGRSPLRIGGLFAPTGGLLFYLLAAEQCEQIAFKSF
ncbi:hypothetical protein ASE07_27680 [Noviherbaspirillum sp. Root189]|nr:hypothetical protein ASE07_27680 [Noviherbaspirillum sp. Root189]